MGSPIVSRSRYEDIMAETIPVKLRWDDLIRLMRIFPKVNPHHAATAMLLDAIEQAEAINRKGAQ